MKPEELIEKAKEARSLSYSPYSHFAVGAALLCKDGSVYVGANIENSSYPLCMCAERNALYNAKMHGVKKEDITKENIEALYKVFSFLFGFLFSIFISQSFECS